MQVFHFLGILIPGIKACLRHDARIMACSGTLFGADRTIDNTQAIACPSLNVESSLLILEIVSLRKLGSYKLRSQDTRVQARIYFCYQRLT